MATLVRHVRGDRLLDHGGDRRLRRRPTSASEIVVRQQWMPARPGGGAKTAANRRPVHQPRSPSSSSGCSSCVAPAPASCSACSPSPAERASFKQVLAVYVHSGVIGTVWTVVTPSSTTSDERTNDHEPGRHRQRHRREGLRPGLLQRPRPHRLPGAVRARDRPRRALPPADPAHLRGSLRGPTWSSRSSSAPSRRPLLEVRRCPQGRKSSSASSRSSCSAARSPATSG